jgi:putative endonuclease
MGELLYYVYLLQNDEGRLYIGSTSDLERRVLRHQDNEGGWTRGRGPWRLVRQETFDDRAKAMKRERSLKTGRTNIELRRALSDSLWPKAAECYIC